VSVLNGDYKEVGGSVRSGARRAASIASAAKSGFTLNRRLLSLIPSTLALLVLGVLADVHANLYQDSRSDRLDVAVYLGDLCQRLYASYFEPAPGGVRMVVDIQPCRLDVDRAIPLGLIVNELVTNAFKHGFDAGKGGAVRVRLGPASASTWRLDVSDDGTGADHGAGGANGQGAGVNRQGGGLGMQLVQAFVSQLGGSLRVEDWSQYRVVIDLPWNDDDTIRPSA
jgi:two-component sensor histidine kinase